ncbi:hypothetical protein FE257_011872 [Aspergillus nanangensis]|uniref:DUF803 domain protein n=1 Tax=Aspergillus nanangensis TaxID=2582783 RepID=A0AAD4GQF4_ASPNN|nr:hypothetical protein FE257_011872 [Aspergillus nanangensis]
MGNLGGLSPQGSVAVGVIIGLISTSLQAIGLTYQRKSHMLEDEKFPYDIRRPPYKRRRWQLGMLMFVVSNIVGSTIQITTLPLPVLSTLQASGLVFNTIFATLILGEPFTRYSLIGTLLVCTGAVLIAVFGAIGEPAHTLDQLLELLQRRNFILWMMGTGILVLAIWSGSKLLKYLTHSPRSKHPGVHHTYTPRIPMAQSRVRLIRGLCYGLVSGILSAHTLLLAKSAVELLVRTVVDRVNQFNRWQSWVILIAMIAVALIQLYALHRGLKLCSTSILYPFVFCIYNIIAILDGLIYFRQMSQLTGFHAGLIALGTIVLLGGVLCLSWRLEVIDSHAAVTVVGPSQTGLGPGMAIVEEHPRNLLQPGADDEEAQTGEREPLLRGLPGRRASHQRTPSLPLFNPPMPQRNSTDVDPASIWAELDDSDYEDRNSDVRSSLLHHAPIDPFKTRPRSQTSTGTLKDAHSRGPLRHSATSSLSQTTWNTRRVPASIREARRHRRTSAPAPNNVDSSLLHNGVSYIGPFFEAARDRITGYGTQDDRSDEPFLARRRSGQEPRRSSSSGRADSHLTELRRTSTLHNAWRTGIGYLSRLTARNKSHDDPENNSRSRSSSNNNQSSNTQEHDT